jgi:hypothetical protein
VRSIERGEQEAARGNKKKRYRDVLDAVGGDHSHTVSGVIEMNEEYDANVSAIADEILTTLSSHPVMEGIPALALVMVSAFEQLAGDSDVGFNLATNSIQFFKQTLDVLEESLAKAPEGTIIQ